MVQPWWAVGLAVPAVLARGLVTGGRAVDSPDVRDIIRQVPTKHAQLATISGVKFKPSPSLS